MQFTLLVACLSLSPSCAGGMPAFRPDVIEHGRLEGTGDSWILTLEGSPKERGRAAGVLTGAQIRWLLPRYLRQVAAIERLSPHHRAVVAQLGAELPAAHRAQLHALADAAQVDRATLLAVNLAPEMLAELACSCLATTAAASADGRVRFARNLDWPGGGVLVGAEIITIESGEGHRFASFAWPGLVGVVTGMNDVGLTAANLVALKTGNRRPQPGVPVLFAVRTMLERTGTADEALTWLRGARRTMPQNYALADRNEVRVVESGPFHDRVRDVGNGGASITNYWHEETGHAGDGRYARLAAVAAGRPGLSQLQRALAGSALGALNVQAVVLEPETGVAHGKPPAAKGQWQTIDLSARLRPPVGRAR